ncbi:mannose-1-phosphate guanylyltransferase/mannose-6-phosphate isomerase [Guyparkeria sp. SB14A]|uniref:mannose-1-phosphate guanylyltransferase/mannose-6-phosphate isomerase n=1 Tax=Guyparkeria sp. SB14A TaxID=2571147 RepID=UPI0010AD79E8|nr:mannose-1-phosphate guanylyltransferase/mannose-6-phosphate isomerase [Guyparkeria sp. SB14A]TKA89442.1 mannose-1-phosphate guanylyltransferase/mannose-6-phosphate isomerase [Guyparkeria sp. SB14A]
MQLIPAILCGGSGTRLWPVSRELHPKPFIRLADGESLLQKSYLRGAQIPGVAEVLTVTNRELFFKTEDEFREVGAQLDHVVDNSFILEPFGRNTAAAVAASSLHIAEKYSDDAVVLVLAADHLIADRDAFEAAVGEACELAAEGRLVTFGIKPDAPETGYGYIEAQGSRVLRFVEKPSLEKAREYLDDGRYLWNSGMFCFRAGTMIRELDEHAPNVLSAVRACLEVARKAEGDHFSQVELTSDSFDPVPEDSIDYAVMEKTKNASVVACDIGWSDIGSWAALGDLSPADEENNRVDGNALLHDTHNCYIKSDERLVGAVGVDNLIIVDTPDALLVADKRRAQEVKKLYSELKEVGHEAHRLHRTVHRPWGTYTVLEEGERFKIKRIVVKPGGNLSLQMHHHRSEHWVVVSGMARVFNDGKELLLGVNESTYISAGHTHRLENPGVVELVMIEVQSGEYLGEDDIVRFEDIYGRS